jgi:hypothetical protein
MCWFLIVSVHCLAFAIEKEKMNDGAEYKAAKRGRKYFSGKEKRKKNARVMLLQL